MSNMSNYLRTDKISNPSKIRPSHCTRCGGTGTFGPVQVYMGRCLRCQGTGIDPTHKDWGFPVEWTDEQCAEFMAADDAKKEARRAKRAEARRAELDAKMAENLARFPELAEPFQEPLHHIVEDIRDKAWRFSISEAQAALVLKVQTEALNRREEKEAEEAKLIPVPSSGERSEITGEVLSVQWRDSQYGGSFKMLVKVTTDAGVFKLWGTVPSAIDPDKGDVVTFTAKLQASEDVGFGFFSRPTKASVAAE